MIGLDSKFNKAAAKNLPTYNAQASFGKATRDSNHSSADSGAKMRTGNEDMKEIFKEGKEKGKIIAVRAEIATDSAYDVEVDKNHSMRFGIGCETKIPSRPSPIKDSNMNNNEIQISLISRDSKIDPDQFEQSTAILRTSPAMSGITKNHVDLHGNIRKDVYECPEIESLSPLYVTIGHSDEESDTVFEEIRSDRSCYLDLSDNFTSKLLAHSQTGPDIYSDVEEDVEDDLWSISLMSKPNQPDHTTNASKLMRNRRSSTPTNPEKSSEGISQSDKGMTPSLLNTNRKFAISSHNLDSATDSVNTKLANKSVQLVSTNNSYAEYVRVSNLLAPPQANLIVIEARDKSMGQKLQTNATASTGNAIEIAATTRGNYAGGEVKTNASATARTENAAGNNIQIDSIATVARSSAVGSVMKSKASATTTRFDRPGSQLHTKSAAPATRAGGISSVLQASAAASKFDETYSNIATNAVNGGEARINLIGAKIKPDSSDRLSSLNSLDSNPPLPSICSLTGNVRSKHFYSTLTDLQLDSIDRYVQFNTTVNQVSHDFSEQLRRLKLRHRPAKHS